LYYSHIDNSMQLLADGSARVYITSGGLVGIGTASPSQLLHVEGNALLNGASKSLQIGSSGANWLYFAATSGGSELSHNNNAFQLITSQVNGITFSTNGTDECARIDSSGRLLVGTSSSRSDLVGLSPQIQLEGATQSATSLSLTRNEATSAGPALLLAKSRGTTAGAATVVQSGDTLGGVYFMGADGTNIEIGAQITGEVDATPGNNDLPSRLVFSTTADGYSSPTQRYWINQEGRHIYYNTGYIYPNTDNVVQLGGPSNRFTAVYAVNGSIQTSDQREKTHIEAAALGSDFIRSLRPVSYKWIEGGKRDTGERDEDNNCIYESVPGQRTHWGFIAQDVKQAVDAAGVDFGGWVLTDKDDPDSQQALRYDQFIAPLTKALQEALAEIDVLKAKVAALESA
jgi:hypothetical protein